MIDWSVEVKEGRKEGWQAHGKEKRYKNKTHTHKHTHTSETHLEELVNLGLEVEGQRVPPGLPEPVRHAVRLQGLEALWWTLVWCMVAGDGLIIWLIWVVGGCVRMYIDGEADPWKLQKPHTPCPTKSRHPVP